MRIGILIPVVVLLSACQVLEEPEPIKEIVSDCHDVKVEDVLEVEFPKGDTVVIPESFVAYEIDDYYSYFFGTSVSDIKNNTPEEAFKYGTFILNNIDYQNGYISFRTQNTPLDMDGDSEEEDGYEITYWVQSDSSRIVAFCKTKYSWVDEASELTLFLHDKNGINKITPTYGNWTLNDFLDEDVSIHFSQELINNPPVYITLPNEGKEIRIDLALGEYYEPMEVYEKFDSLKLTRYTLMVNPHESKFEKIKAW